MKFLLVLLVSLGASVSHAAEIHSAKLDASSSEIVMDVVYSGGCANHKFSLELVLCRESSPVSCVFQLKDKTADFCEAIVSKTVAVSLASAKLDTKYYAGGSITILGENNTTATIILPSSDPQGDFFADSAEVSRGEFNSATNTIDFVASHGGGCGEHKYSLQVETCLETFPVQCTATLIHLTNDRCEALISREVKLTLQEVGLDNKYYSNASLTITGANGSKVSLVLPKIN